MDDEGKMEDKKAGWNGTKMNEMKIEDEMIFLIFLFLANTIHNKSTDLHQIT